MFSRNMRSAAELSCNPLLLRQLHKPKIGYAQFQVRQPFHNSRHMGRRRPRTEDPFSQPQIVTGPLSPKSLLKPLLFTVGVTSISLTGCVIWEYENLRSHAKSLLKRPSSWLNSHKQFNSHRKEDGQVKKWWNSLKTTEKVFYPILAANILVFGAWRVKSMQPFMIKYFCSNPSGRAVCLPMLLSTFSHYSTMHLAANMYVLYSFMPAAMASLGKEQFVALYLSAGVISSFASVLYKVILNQPGLSLGASGAIMSVLAYVCTQYPDTRLSIIFLPMYTFAASSAIKVIMSIDLAGVVLGWKFFDHAAHLGGALFGL
ncbi:unnamed protein product [Leptidea sinapis]|uniref:rhomboid protease n=1 Tax=Leptidea sinapis TaxID=189913 RepID=A0A5E4Q2S0_9NEOP|nr:unnamed protein product [Leptidea sinapis]